MLDNFNFDNEGEDDAAASALVSCPQATARRIQALVSEAKKAPGKRSKKIPEPEPNQLTMTEYVRSQLSRKTGECVLQGFSLVLTLPGLSNLDEIMFSGFLV